MRLTGLVVLGAAIASIAEAHCPNACTGHGTCSSKDQCVCDPGYQGNDCSERICQFELAFVDTPRGDLNHNGQLDYTTDAGGLSKVQWSSSLEYEAFPRPYTASNTDPITAAEGEAHFYSECSGRGQCNRGSGECECFPGFTGSACQRTSCPNDCSGNGVCRTSREVAALAQNKRQYAGIGGQKLMSGVQNPFDYQRWDADKATSCICDPGFTGADCALRMCPRNDDPLTNSDRYCGGQPCAFEVQTFTLSDSPLTTYRVGYTDSFNGTYYVYVSLDVSSTPNGFVEPALLATKQAGPLTSAGQLQASLRAMPTGVFSRVEVSVPGNAAATPGADSTRLFRVTFVGVGGDQSPLTIETVSGTGTLWYNPDHEDYNAAVPAEASRVVVELTRGNYEEIECSGRGNCDTDSGMCTCFAGYSGASCETQNALSM